MATASDAGRSPEGRTSVDCSVVIPIYNGAAFVGTTVDRVLALFEAMGLRPEIILVNDGSTDRTWEVIRRKAEQSSRVVAVDLLRNYGQHPATMCGLRVSSGRYVVTMDDDLQHAPEAIGRLIAKGLEGHDLVFARFESKQHAMYKRLGSRLVTSINRAAFGLPSDLVVSSFRLIRRDVVDRMLAREHARPYVTGLALMCSRNPANVPIEHHRSVRGHTTYGVSRLLGLMTAILLGRLLSRTMVVQRYEVREIVRVAET